MAAQASHGYTPYGAEDTVLSAGDTGSDPLNPHHYSGHRFDVASQTLDLGARRFGPDVLRFLQRDAYLGAARDLPLGLHPLTQNRYRLEGSNPAQRLVLDVSRSNPVVLDDGERRSVWGWGWPMPPTSAAPASSTSTTPMGWAA